MADKNIFNEVAVAALKAIAPEVAERLLKGLEDSLKGIKTTYGLVHKRVPAEISGKKGFLIWDYILYNEITFQSEDGSIMSFFNSISDEETETEWNTLVQKYGV